MEALTSYSTFLNIINIFVDLFIPIEVLALHKLGQPIILLLENYCFITQPSVIVHIVVIISDLFPHLVLYPYGVFFKTVTYPLFNSLGKPLIFR